MVQAVQVFPEATLKTQVLQPTSIAKSPSMTTIDQTIDQVIQLALDEARMTTVFKGSQSVEAAVAWDAVEELMIAKAKHRLQRTLTAFEQYCEQNPDAIECRIYDV